jgi:hypothetical protein
VTEKWMQSKGNPFMKKRNPINSFKRIKRTNSAHAGFPAQLFKDSDKDGVANVFDCKPYNKKKTDVMSPMSGSNPMQEMYGRQEYARQQAAYMKMLAEARRLEEERLEELRRLGTPINNYYTTYSGGTSSGGTPGGTYVDPVTGQVMSTAVLQAKTQKNLATAGPQTVFSVGIKGGQINMNKEQYAAYRKGVAIKAVPTKLTEVKPKPPVTYPARRAPVISRILGRNK